MNRDSRILIVGHNDVIENSLYDSLRAQGFLSVYSSSKIALKTTIQPSVYDFFQQQRPEYIFLGSVLSGGIEANQRYGAEFLYQNLESQNNIFYASQKFGAKKLLYIGASCVYPKDCPQPMKEEYLLTGPLEKTSEPYSIAKIAGIKLCESYKRQYGFNAVAIVPATVYGPGSDTDLEKAHVLGALLAKFSKAAQENQKEVVVWGSGNPQREFLHCDDFVEACLFLMNHYDDAQMMNVGCGEDVSIRELASLMAEVVGFKGTVKFDSARPDGAARKLLDNNRIKNAGWKPRVTLKDGLKRTLEWYSKTVKV